MKLKKSVVIILALILPMFSYAQKRDTHERLNAVLWMQTSAEYKTLTVQTYRQAWKQIEKIIARAKSGYGIPSAAIEQPGLNIDNLPYAIILDIDETVLDNSPMWGKMIETGSGNTEKNWKNWVKKESASFIPGAEEFIKKALSANIAIVFITNRTYDEEENTIRDLKPFVVTDDQILTLEEKENPASAPWPREKTFRRKFIAQKFWIIGMIGDDLGDFIPNIIKMTPQERKNEANRYQEKFGKQWFLLPNPVYGSWERVLYNPKDPDEKKLQDKKKHVESYDPD